MIYLVQKAEHLGLSVLAKIFDVFENELKNDKIILPGLVVHCNNQFIAADLALE